MGAIMKNQKGQLVLEAILLMVVFMGLSTLLTNYLKENKVAARLVSEPWGKLSGMIECGVWQPCAGNKGLHPLVRDRVLSLSPDPAQGDL
jgi:hypothetical protein